MKTVSQHRIALMVTLRPALIDPEALGFPNDTAIHLIFLRPPSYEVVTEAPNHPRALGVGSHGCFPAFFRKFLSTTRSRTAVSLYSRCLPTTFLPWAAFFDPVGRLTVGPWAIATLPFGLWARILHKQESFRVLQWAAPNRRRHQQLGVCANSPLFRAGGETGRNSVILPSPASFCLCFT